MCSRYIQGKVISGGDTTTIVRSARGQIRACIACIGNYFSGTSINDNGLVPFHIFFSVNNLINVDLMPHYR